VKMSLNLKKCMRQLQLIAAIKNPKTREAVLKDFSCNKCLYKALREIARNTIKRNVPLRAEHKLKLRRYAPLIKQLACKKLKKPRRTRAVIQSGGFLPVLIPIIASILADNLLG
jgi:hypothetical protein